MTHDELSDDARSLLASGKSARMPDETRDRLRTAVLAQVVVAGGAAAVVAKASAAANHATVGWSLFAKSMFVASAMTIAGGGVYLAVQNNPDPATTSPTEHAARMTKTRARSVSDTPPSTPEVVPAPTPVLEAPAPVPQPDIPTRPREHATSPPATPQSLELAEPDLPLSERVDEEARLIRNAIARNREGRYEDALRFLRTHAMLHPTGALVDERTASQIEALCGLHRESEAATIRDAFLAQHPGSPLRARMMQACASP